MFQHYVYEFQVVFDTSYISKKLYMRYTFFYSKTTGLINECFNKDVTKFRKKMIKQIQCIGIGGF